MYIAEVCWVVLIIEPVIIKNNDFYDYRNNVRKKLIYNYGRFKRGRPITEAGSIIIMFISIIC